MTIDLTATLAALNDPDRRLAAIDALGASGDLRAGPALIQSLASYRGDVRARAARALRQVHDPAARAPLIARAKGDPFGAVALWSLVALEAQGAAIPTDVVGHAFRTRAGIAHWTARLVTDMRKPEMREMARSALEALGPEAMDGIADALLGRTTQPDALEQIGLADAVAAVLVRRVLTRAPDAARAGRWLASSGRPWTERALEDAIFGEGEWSGREALLADVASVNAGPRMGWVRSVLTRAASSAEPPLARAAAAHLRARGAPAPGAAPHGAMRSGRGVLSPPIADAGLLTLARTLARRMGITDEPGAPVHEETPRPARLPGWTASRSITEWRIGPITLRRIEDGEEHPHEGGGSVVSAVLRTPEGEVLLQHGFSRYLVLGPSAALEAHLIAAVQELGWSAAPWVHWNGGRVVLDETVPARVFFESPDHAWHVDLDASDDSFACRDSMAEVVGGLLLVWTGCEHVRGGGGPYLNRLHRVREDGTVAWMRDIDAVSAGAYGARLTERGLEVLAGWSTSDRSPAPPTWRVLDPETGETPAG